ARSEADEATAAMGDFGEVDKRARDYIRAGQALMAGDVIYTEGGQAVASAQRHVEMARQAERQASDATQASRKKQQAMAVGGAGAPAALVVLLLAPSVRTDEEDPALSTGARPQAARVGITLGIEPDEGIVSHARPASASSARTTAGSGAKPPT